MKNNNTVRHFAMTLSITCVVILSGCQVVKKSLYNPASSMARVNPLFMGPECIKYDFPNGEYHDFWAPLQSIHHHDCDDQIHSINTFNPLTVPDVTKPVDEIYSKLCNSLNVDGEAWALEAQFEKFEQQAKKDADQAKLDMEQAKKDNVQYQKDVKAAKAAPKNSALAKKMLGSKQKAEASLKLADTSQQQADTSALKVANAHQPGMTFVVENGRNLAKQCLKYLASRSDEICELHKSHIYSDRAVTNTILNILASGTGIAGSMSGVGAAQALAGASGFLTGSEAIVDNEVFHNLVTHAIIKELDDNRKEFLNAKFTEYDSLTMPVGVAGVRQDANTYHEKCSFYNGLSSLLNKAGNDKTGTPALDKLKAQHDSLIPEIADLKSKIDALDPAKDSAKLSILNQQLMDKTKRLDMINGIIASVVIPTK